jgi:DNA-binding LytR/AlgR family response regulator
MEDNFKGLRIAVCDDMPEDRRNLITMIRKYLDANGHLAMIDQYASGEDFLKVDLTKYDLVFLDIYMAKITGIQTAKQLVQRNPNVQIIFCSSSNEYAAESYDVNALRYIVKPIREEKLQAALSVFLHAHKNIRTLNFKVNRMDEQVYVSDIYWIEADGHKCTIHTRNGPISTRTTLAQLEEQLEGLNFVRPIRYALVSIAAVAAIPSNVLTLVNGETIPISRDQKANMTQAYMEHKMRSLMQKGGNRDV